MVANSKTAVNSPADKVLEALVTGANLQRDGNRYSMKLFIVGGWILVTESGPVQDLKNMLKAYHAGPIPVHKPITVSYTQRGSKFNFVAVRAGAPAPAFEIGSTGEGRIMKYSVRGSAGDGGKTEIWIEGEPLTIIMGERDGMEALTSVKLPRPEGWNPIPCEANVMVSFKREQRCLQLISIRRSDEMVVTPPVTNGYTPAPDVLMLAAGDQPSQAESRRDRAVKLLADRTLPTDELPLITPAPRKTMPDQRQINHLHILADCPDLDADLRRLVTRHPVLLEGATRATDMQPLTALDETAADGPIIPSQIAVFRDPKPMQIEQTKPEDEPGEDFFQHGSGLWSNIPRGIRHRQVMHPLERFVDMVIAYVTDERDLRDLRASWGVFEAELMAAKAATSKALGKVEAKSGNPLRDADRRMRRQIEAGIAAGHAEDARRLRLVVQRWLGLKISPTSATYSCGQGEPTYRVKRIGDVTQLTISMYMPRGVRGEVISRTAHNRAEARKALDEVQREYDLKVEALERNHDPRKQKRVRQLAARV